MNNEQQPDLKPVPPDEGRLSLLVMSTIKFFTSDFTDTTSQAQDVSVIPNLANTSAQDLSSSDVIPLPVVKTLSPAGVEYVFMTVALLTGEFGLGRVFIALFNSKTVFLV